MLPNLADQARELTDAELRTFRIVLQREKMRRLSEESATRRDLRLKARFAECAPAIANTLLCVAHAMACREALRWMKGHNPVGPGLASGEMWTAAEGAELEYRVATETGPIVKTPANANTILVSNPLRWRTHAEIAAGCSHTLFKRVSPYSTGRYSSWSF